MTPTTPKVCVRSTCRLEKLFNQYGEKRWQQQCQLNRQPPRGFTNCDDLLWRLYRIEGLKTNRLSYDSFRKAALSILR